ncbi:MAG: dockerin type I domain-containing protein [Ruminococcus sp.]|nr:dockerin type I domain-containing protein [Ruminococcus sp.]
MRLNKIIKGMSSIVLAAAAAVIGTTVIGASAYERDMPTQQEIKDRFEQLYFDVHKITEYTEDYSAVSPYSIGEVSDEDLQYALNSVNFTRFLAGLPDDIQLNDEYNVLCQSSSLVNLVNGKLSHTPAQPAGFPDDIYSAGKTGSNSSNIASGYGTIASSVISGYIDDTDSSNISKMGHRRWILNPSMQYTGFGITGKYTAMYVFDSSRTESFTGDYVAWPPENMPNEFIDQDKVDSYGNYVGYAYTVSLGNSYDTPDVNKVTVQVKSSKLNKTWNLNSSSTDMFSNYLTVNNSGYGMSKCIIFNVGQLPENDTVTVTIKGITKNGVETPINYTVNYFDLLDDSYDAIGVEEKTYEIEVGETIYIQGYHNPLNSKNFTWGYTLDLASCTDFSSSSIIGDMVKLTGTKPGSGQLYVANTSTRATINVVESKSVHTHTYSPWTTITAAGVNKTGTRQRTCTGCGNVETETIPAVTAALSNCTISISPVTAECTGSEIKPAVTVKYNGTALTNGTDYTVSYSNNVNPGSGTVKITGKGTCTGTVTKTFSITLAQPKLVSAAANSNSITVKWNSVAGANAYTVLRKTSNSDWHSIAASVTGTSYTDKTAAAGIKYWYSVRASYNGQFYGSPYDKTGVSATISKPVSNGSVKIAAEIKDINGVAASDTITAKLVSGNKTYSYTLSGGSVTAAGIPAGTYTLTVSSSKCVSRTQTVTVTSGGTANASVTLCLIGDVNNDGRITTADVGLANSYVRKVKTLTDYQFECADINGDGNITTSDVGRINAHARKTKNLW